MKSRWGALVQFEDNVSHELNQDGSPNCSNAPVEEAKYIIDAIGHFNNSNPHKFICYPPRKRM